MSSIVRISNFIRLIKKQLAKASYLAPGKGEEQSIRSKFGIRFLDFKI
ncbi:hypothetical protein FORC087_331 (plasmid) [Bacillus cereus]|nr:hypothetical protein FORC087_331 [Bacillus cereus]